jgi:hypothetical protein
MVTTPPHTTHRTAPRHATPPTDCADGSCIAAVGKDSKVAILDATNGQLIAQWESEIVPKRDRLLTVCW